MSRGLQMLVEEGAHSSCAHAVRSVGSRNRPRFHQKTVKTAFRPRPKDRKRQKLHFGHGRKIENSKNCVSGHPDGLKTAKTAFPNFGKVKNTRKLRFPTLGKPKPLENCVSP